MSNTLVQRTVDRIALTGAALALVSAVAFIALDPVQTVVRRVPAAPAAAPAEPAATAAPVAAESTPLVRLALPSAAWSVVTDGRSIAYARLKEGEPGEIVVRSLVNEDWRVAYRAAAGSYLGQLSLRSGMLAFEELAQAQPGRTIVRLLNVATGERRVVDQYTPLGVRYGEGGGYISSSPVTDGARVFWIHQTLMPKGGVCNEIRVLDVATGEDRLLYQKMAPISGLAVHGDTLAFTMVTKDAAHAYTVDVASGALSQIDDGFSVSYVQSVGPAGVVVSGAERAAVNSASWLIRADGTRTRIASSCFNVTVTDRVIAMRCGSQIEIRDLATGASLYAYSGSAGPLAVYDRGVVWGEGDSLVKYELPPVPPL